MECHRNSPGRSALSEDVNGMANAVFLPAPPRKAAKPHRTRHFVGMEPMHAAAALDSKGMAAALARGSR